MSSAQARLQLGNQRILVLDLKLGAQQRNLLVLMRNGGLRLEQLGHRRGRVRRRVRRSGVGRGRGRLGVGMLSCRRRVSVGMMRRMRVVMMRRCRRVHVRVGVRVCLCQVVQRLFLVVRGLFLVM